MIFVLALAILAVGCGVGRAAPDMFLGSCSPETARPDAEGRAAEATALAFAQNLEAGNTSVAWSQMTAGGQSATSQQQLTEIEHAIRDRAPTGTPKVVAAFVLHLTMPPKTMAFVPCLSQSSRKGMDFIGAGPNPKQGYVVLQTATLNSVSAYSISLASENGNWRVVRFHFDPAVMAGRDGLAWWQLAKKQHQEGHLLNAWLSYLEARTLLSRGPDYRPLGLADVTQELAKLPIPAELGGKPPFAWSMDGKTFKILKVGVVGVERDQALLALTHQSSWTTDAQAIELNHQLIDAYLKAHLEWAEVFDLLAAEACRPDGRCFGTTYEKGRGYSH